MQAGGDQSNQGNSITTDEFDNIYITGQFNGVSIYGDTLVTSLGITDMFILCIDNQGEFLWFKQAGGTVVKGKDICIDKNNNVIVTGEFRGPSDFDQFNLLGNGIFVAKYNSYGIIRWAIEDGGVEDDEGTSIITDSYNNVMLTGLFLDTGTFGDTTLVSKGSADAFVAMYDSIGSFQWVKHIGGDNEEQGMGVGVDSENNTYVTGYFEDTIFLDDSSITSIQGNDIFIAKLNTSGVSFVDDYNAVLRSFELKQNYPNPFNPTTKIKYQIPQLSFVTIKVYDVLGNEISTLVKEEKPQGSYEVEFKATNFPSGIYFYRLQAGNFVETKKMLLLK